MSVILPCKNPEEVAKEAFWLAYISCGGPRGMGVYQARAGATKEEVWENVLSQGDYPGSPRSDSPGEARGDYVFGKMMKLSLRWNAEGVEVDEYAPRPNYQSWCLDYPTYLSLIQTAIKNCGG